MIEQPPAPAPRRTEWPTLALAALVYAGWALVTRFHAALPGWALVAAGGWLTAWHGSLQHETIHGHPTRSRALNALIGAVPLALWLPYARYRRDHLAHHRDEIVTHPVADPETRYLAAPPDRLRAIVAASQATLAGRLLLGPAVEIAGFALAETRRLRTAPAAVLRDWVPHLAGVAAVLGWLAWCGLSPLVYLAAFVYPGLALSLLRSFAEHRADPTPRHRVAVVEDRGPLALLYLNNNLHALHHARPALPWYALPAAYARDRRSILAGNGGLVYRGYGEVVRRFAFRRHDALVHPFAA